MKAQEQRSGKILRFQCFISSFGFQVNIWNWIAGVCCARTHRPWEVLPCISSSAVQGLQGEGSSWQATLSLRRFTPNAKQVGFTEMSFNDFVDAANPNPCACGTIFPRKLVEVLIF